MYLLLFWLALTVPQVLAEPPPSSKNFPRPESDVLLLVVTCVGARTAVEDDGRDSPYSWHMAYLRVMYSVVTQLWRLDRAS